MDRSRTARFERGLPNRGLPDLMLFPALLLWVAACEVTPEYLRKDIQERRLADTGVEEVGPIGTSPSVRETTASSVVSWRGTPQEIERRPSVLLHSTPR